MKGLTLIASACLLAPGAAFAQMSYTFVEGSLVDIELDGPGNVDGDGIEIAGAYEIDDRFFVLGRWQDQDLDLGIDGRLIELGAGLHYALNETVDFVATLTYFDAELDAGNLSADDDGLGISGGVRAQLAPEWEVEAGLKLVDTNDSGTDSAFSFGGRYYLKENMAVAAAADFGDDADTIKTGFRLEF
jgi:hypothetical protein